MSPVWLPVLFYWLIQQGVDATINPSGPTVSVDCGGQQTFNCSVTGIAPQWTITGLDGITATGNTGQDVDRNNDRVTTTDSSGAVQTSTITITGFTTADNGGTVQCVNLDDSAVQGMTTVSVATLASATAVMANVTQCPATLTWSEPSDPSATTSVSCTPSSPQCSSCTSSGCTIGGLNSSTSYTFSVTRSRSGCDDSTAMSSAVTTVAIDCPLATSPPSIIPTTISIGLYVGAPVGGGVVVVVVGVSSYGITILIMGFTCYSSLGFLALVKCLCCPCCTGKARKSSSKQRIDSASPVTPPAQPPAQAPSDEYADPQAIRDRKERGKEDKDKIQYAAIDFSAGAGSGAGEVKIHQKEEPVIYTAIQHV